MPHASNDPLITEALDSGHFTTDPETGWVQRHGKPCGSVTKTGYVVVGYYRSRLLAHRIIWIAAHGPINPELQVNHRNDRKWDNRLVNLEAVIAQQNRAHANRDLSYTAPLPTDIAAVDPSWMARALDLAKDPDATTDQILALVGGPQPDEIDVPYLVGFNRVKRKQPIWTQRS